MWIEINLLLQIELVIFSHEVIEQGDRHDQGYLSGPIAVDDA
jgi:hypothetical protein